MRSRLVLLVVLLVSAGGMLPGPSAAAGRDLQRFGSDQSYTSFRPDASRHTVSALRPPSVSFARAPGCDTMITATERRYGIPRNLLRAIANVESGRLVAAAGPIEPWPWTVNAEGRGIFFNSKSTATAWVRQQQSVGVQSIDVGCLQVNLFQHPEAFRSLNEAFEPAANADFAGRFLVQLYHASGSWVTAVGFYHSQTAELAADYRKRVHLALQDNMACFTRPDTGEPDVDTDKPAIESGLRSPSYGCRQGRWLIPPRLKTADGWPDARRNRHPDQHLSVAIEQ